ncbi:MAG: alpha/beta fold hydrolase [Candidatus Solibacter usitatus]|nr:alpha/beta fold hydrolase [Candidatus Solibacter usitatus]
MFTTVAGNRIYYESRGEGSAVVFIHGLGGACSIWYPQAQALSARQRTVIYDWLGSGNSAKPRGEHSVEAWAAEAKGLCDALEISAAAFVGHSLGAAVAVTVAARYPELARAIALLGPVTKLPGTAVNAIRDRAAKVRSEGMGPMADALPMGALAAATRERNPAVHALFRALILANDAASYAAHCEALLRADASALLGEVRCPALLIAGEADPTAPPAAVQELAGRIAGSRVVEIADAAHAMQLDQPAQVGRVLGEFFEAVL